MPFVEGESLRARLARGELPIGEAITIMRDVARALEYAHGKGIAHRDIKPDNVLLNGKSAVITDFGVAKAITDAAAGTALTSIGIALGTPAYMAPEQAAADPSTDTRADIYAFGVVAYEMLAGHAPFAGRSAHSVLAAHATEAPPPIRTLRPVAPPALATLVMRCLEKRPADRPQSAAEIVEALDAIVPTSAGIAGSWIGRATTEGRATAWRSARRPTWRPSRRPPTRTSITGPTSTPGAAWPTSASPATRRSLGDRRRRFSPPTRPKRPSRSSDAAPACRLAWRPW
jgi:serine/threonine-protein kinase